MNEVSENKTHEHLETKWNQSLEVYLQERGYYDSKYYVLNAFERKLIQDHCYALDKHVYERTEVLNLQISLCGLVLISSHLVGLVYPNLHEAAEGAFVSALLISFLWTYIQYTTNLAPYEESRNEIRKKLPQVFITNETSKRNYNDEL